MHARDDDITAMPRARPADEAILVARLQRRRGPAAVVEGLTAPLRGFAYMVGRPALWPYGIWPIILNVLITAGVLVGLVFGLMAASDRLKGYFSGSWFANILAWGSRAALFFFAAAAATVLWFGLQGVLCDFFYLRLARRVELDVGLPAGELHEIPLLHDLADTLVSLLLLVAVNLALLCLYCVPVLGWVLAPVCGFLFTCWIFGLDFLRFPLVLRGLRRAQRRAVCREHLGQTLGVGAVVFACNLLPIINAILLTGAVVGGVLLHRDLRAGRAGPLASRQANY
jgi:uncharacterized protein involved in cysteine biosynthesis